MAPRKRVTITDIARQAGVSRGAVSFALNGRPGVSEQTRSRIMAIADEHGWQPDRAARALGGARLDVIGLVVERPATSLGAEAFFTDLIAGIQSGLAATDVSMLTRVVGDSESEIRTYRTWHGSRHVDGVIVIDPRDDDPRLAVLSELGLPAVVIGSAPGGPGEQTTVWLDDRKAAHTLFDHLRDLGHERIAYVTGPAEFQHTRIRAEVLTGLGADGTVVVTDFSPSAATAATERLLAASSPPTAIVYDNEVMAIAGLRVAQKRDIRVPDDVSIASFDDSVIAGLMHPSITSLTRDTLALGELAASHLLAQLDSDDPLPSIAAPVPVLSRRESTAPPRDRR